MHMYVEGAKLTHLMFSIDDSCSILGKFHTTSFKLSQSAFTLKVMIISLLYTCISH